MSVSFMAANSSGCCYGCRVAFWDDRRVHVYRVVFGTLSWPPLHPNRQSAHELYVAATNSRIEFGFLAHCALGVAGN